MNSQTLYTELVEIFKKYIIPWTNLCSILMDSCAVMRGSKSGLETLIHEKVAPHLLDIDGDVCHHMHNATKVFCKPFKSHVEQLFHLLFAHFKWSTDLRAYLSTICGALSIKFTMPERFLTHRWLSVYDVSLSTIRIIKAYFVFFFAYLSKDDKQIYQELLDNIYEECSVDEDRQQIIKDVQRQIKL